jgi:hypothetical protein
MGVGAVAVVALGAEMRLRGHSSDLHERQPLAAGCVAGAGAASFECPDAALWCVGTACWGHCPQPLHCM